MSDLKTELYFTIHGATKSVEQIADECGISASYLYRACLEGESGCRFPLDLLLPIMQSTGNYRVLDHLNSRCGKVTANTPRVSKLKKRDPQVVNEISSSFHETMSEVLKFFEAPDPAKIPSLIARLHQHMCEVASLKKAVSSFQQQELL